jgi:hypothetical protein
LTPFGKIGNEPNMRVGVGILSSEVVLYLQESLPKIINEDDHRQFCQIFNSQSLNILDKTNTFFPSLLIIFNTFASLLHMN